MRVRLSAGAVLRVPIAVLVISFGLGAADTTPAFAAITQPATSGSPATYTIPVDSNDNALPFTITANGFAANQAGVVPEICDGTPSTAHSWSPGLDCDNQTSPTPRPADSTGSITFSATNSNQQIVDFNGASPNGLFNCISTDEVPSDATAGPLAGEYQLSQNDSQVTNAAGQTITLNPGYPAWTNCQLRVSSNDAIATADQQFITLTIAATSVTRNDSVTLTESPGSPETSGTAVNLTATVTPSVSSPLPTGTLNFTADGVTICAQVALSPGTCTWTPTTSTSHVYTIEATYSGDSNFPSESSAAATYTINPATSTPTDTVTVAETPSSPEQTGTPITLTATVTPSGSNAALDGVLSFSAGGSTICSNVAVANPTCTWTPTVANSYSIAASYSGDTVYPNGSSSAATYVITAPSGILEPDTNPYAVPESTGGTGNLAAGTPLPFNIEASGFQSKQLVVPEICDGLPPTTRGWDPNFECDNQTSPTPQPANTSGVANFSASNSNQQIVDFRGEGPADLFNCLAPQDLPVGSTPNSDGSFTLPSDVTVTANGEPVDPNQKAWTDCQLRISSNDAAVTSDQEFLTLSIPNTIIGSQTASVTLNAVPSDLSEPADTSINLTARVAATQTGGPTPTGTVTYVVGDIPITNCSGLALTATCTWAPLNSGQQSVTAEYSGDATYLAAASTAREYDITALPTTTTLAVSPGAITRGGVATLTATVTGAGPEPTGSVGFSSNGMPIVGCAGQTLGSTGKAVCETTLLLTGDDALTATYGGNHTYHSSTSTSTVQIAVSSPPNPARVNPVLLLNSSPSTAHVGGPTQLTLSVYGAAAELPTGTAAFYANGQRLSGCTDVPVHEGLAICTAVFKARGTEAITASYLGDSSYLPIGSSALKLAVGPPGGGYWMVASDGGVFNFGDATFHGSLGRVRLTAPIVAMAATRDGGGYWLVASDGGVFNFGDAAFHGSLGHTHLASPIIAITPTADDGGYWLVASDGGVFSFGDARYRGSLGSDHLDKPIVGMAATPDGGGYWLVASDGGVFNFGDAQYRGSLGGVHLDKPIVGISSVGAGGYWLVAADGGVFVFGNAPNYGSTGGVALASPIVATGPAPTGYRLYAADGGVFNYGDAGFFGSLGGVTLAMPIVAAATSP